MITNFTLLLLGATGIFLGIRLFNLHFRTAEWPLIDGRLLRKGIKLKSPKKNKPQYSVDAEYEYTIEGQRYRSGVIFELELEKKQKLFSKEQASSALGLLSPALQVHYNPDKPHESFLYRSTLAAPIFSLSTGLLFILIGSVKMVAEF